MKRSKLPTSYSPAMFKEKKKSSSSLYFMFILFMLFIGLSVFHMSPQFYESRLNRIAEVKRKLMDRHHFEQPYKGFVDNSRLNPERALILAELIRRSPTARRLNRAGLGNVTFETFKLPEYYDPKVVRKAPGVDHPIIVDHLVWPKMLPLADFTSRNGSWPLGPVGNHATLEQFMRNYLDLFRTVVNGRTVPDIQDPDVDALRNEWMEMMAQAPEYPARTFKGRGIVIAGGGVKYMISAYVNIRMLRYLGCTLPIELWLLGKEKLTPRLQEIIEGNGVRVRSSAEFLQTEPQLLRLIEANGFTFKAAALLLSSFEEALFLDADVNALTDPSDLFDFKPYKDTGALLWKDYWRLKWMDYSLAKRVFNLTDEELQGWSGGNSGTYPGSYDKIPTPPRLRKYMPFEFTAERVHYEHHTSKETVWTVDSGVMLVRKRKIWRALMLYFYMNLRPEGYHYGVTVPNKIGVGDKETLPVALRVLNMPYYLGETPVGTAGTIDKGHTMVQYRPNTTQPMFLHRNCNKVRSGTLTSSFSSIDRSWQVLAHIPPKFRTVPTSGVDDTFWKCAVSIAEEGFVRQPFQDAILHVDIERTIHELGLELVRNPAYEEYVVSQSRGKYVGIFGHSASNANANSGAASGDAQQQPTTGGRRRTYRLKRSIIEDSDTGRQR